ncbi:MAG: ribosomal protein S18-alanine N-acetyltransferase [Salinisphaeraceae bacterium]|nr:ribosomal protein S18-alanine N-acetyltransferase [Salinisphaeraceae bacterium]
MSAVLDDLWRVRAMTSDDLSQVLDIENVSYNYPWSRGIFEDCMRMGYHCQVMSEGGSGICAYGLVSTAVGEAHLLNLCVAPVFRRTGMARYLLSHLIKIAREHDAYVMYLEVRPSNRGAISLYKQHGFYEIGRRPNYYPAENGREEAVVLSLDIA